MVVRIQESNQAIAFSFELELEPQGLCTFQPLTHSRTSICLTPNKTKHKLRRQLW